VYTEVQVSWGKGRHGSPSASDVCAEALVGVSSLRFYAKLLQGPFGCSCIIHVCILPRSTSLPNSKLRQEVVGAFHQSIPKFPVVPRGTFTWHHWDSEACTETPAEGTEILCVCIVWETTGARRPADIQTGPKCLRGPGRLPRKSVSCSEAVVPCDRTLGALKHSRSNTTTKGEHHVLYSFLGRQGT